MQSASTVYQNSIPLKSPLGNIENNLQTFLKHRPKHKWKTLQFLFNHPKNTLCGLLQTVCKDVLKLGIDRPTYAIFRGAFYHKMAILATIAW